MGLNSALDINLVEVPGRVDPTLPAFPWETTEVVPVRFPPRLASFPPRLTLFLPNATSVPARDLFLGSVILHVYIIPHATGISTWNHKDELRLY